MNILYIIYYIYYTYPLAFLFFPPHAHQSLCFPTQFSSIFLCHVSTRDFFFFYIKWHLLTTNERKHGTCFSGTGWIWWSSLNPLSWTWHGILIGIYPPCLVKRLYKDISYMCIIYFDRIHPTLLSPPPSPSVSPPLTSVSPFLAPLPHFHPSL